MAPEATVIRAGPAAGAASTEAPAAVCAVVVHFRCPDATARCLRSLAEHAPGVRAIVVDNGEGIAPPAPPRDGDLVLRARRNDGYGAGANLGIAAALEDPELRWVLLLNPDAELEAGALDAMLSTARRTGAAAVGARIVSADGTATLFEHGRIPRWTLSGCQVPAPDAGDEAPCEFVSGACTLLDAELLRDGLRFDERYFLYVEDLDLCAQIAALGREVVVCRGARVRHADGGTQRGQRVLGAGMRARQAFHLARGKMLFARKWLRWHERLAYLPCTWLAKPAAALLRAASPLLALAHLAGTVAGVPLWLRARPAGDRSRPPRRTPAARPRVLLVTQQLRTVRSGVGTYARALVAGLCDRGVDVTVASWDDERAPALGGGWIGLGMRPRLDPTPGAFWSLGRRLRARLAARLDAFDLIHFLDAREGHALLRRMPRARVVGTVHDDYAARAARWPGGWRGRCADPWRRWLYYTWLRRLERRCLPRFDLLLANSAATAESLREVYGAERCSRVTLAVPALVGGRPAELRGSPRLLFCGGNFWRKGLDRVVRALPALRASHPGLVLHVAGRDRARPGLERIAGGLGVADAIEWHGALDPERYAGVLRSADVLVVPSRTEALGLVYLEAFAAGVPVVAGGVGGVTEIVRDGESGLCARGEGAAAVATAVARVLGEEELRARLVEGGSRVLREHTTEHLVADTLAGYGLVRVR